MRVMACLLANAAAAWLGAAQASGQCHGGGGSSTSRPVSPSVVASWSSRWGCNSSTTTLLVLWRGTPGWFAKEGHHGGSAGSGGGSGGSWAYETISEGGLTFVLSYDVERKTVKILDEEISLEQSNVLLVDAVDGPTGPRIVGRLWIEPDPPDTPAQPDAIAAIVKRSPELQAYLQCDLTPPADKPVLQMLSRIVCAQMRP